MTQQLLSTARPRDLVKLIFKLKQKYLSSLPPEMRERARFIIIVDEQEDLLFAVLMYLDMHGHLGSVVTGKAQIGFHTLELSSHQIRKFR